MEYTYSLIPRSGFSVAGVRKTTRQAGGAWAIVKADGSMQKMQAIAGVGAVMLGLCFGFDEKGWNDNMVGFVTTGDVDGLDVCHFPAMTWAEIMVEGKISDNVLYHAWQEIHARWIDRGVFGQMEQPTIEEYLLWDEAADACRVCIRIPATQLVSED